MNFKFLGLLLPFFLVACAQLSERSVVEVDRQKEQKSKIGQLKFPKQDLTASMLFDFLMGETALQRGDRDVASESYLRLAKITQDPRVAQRATEVALLSRKPIQALDAAKIWVELDPNSILAHQTIATLLVSSNRLDEARVHLDRLLDLEGDAVKFFMQLNNLLARNANKVETLQLVQQFAKPYSEVPEAHFAIAQAASLAGQFETARQQMKLVLILRPDWEMAAVYNGRILRHHVSSASAIEFYENYLEAHPKANKIRIAFAQILVAEKNYIMARGQFKQLLAQNSGNANVALAVGLLWVPLTIATFSSIESRHLAETMSVFHLLRNIGSSIFIALSVTIVVRTSSMNYARFTEFITPYNRLFALPENLRSFNIGDVSGLAAISIELDRQADMIGFLNAFGAFTLASLLAIPLVLLARNPGAK